MLPKSIFENKSISKIFLIYIYISYTKSLIFGLSWGAHPPSSFYLVGEWRVPTPAERENFEK